MRSLVVPMTPLGRSWRSLLTTLLGLALTAAMLILGMRVADIFTVFVGV